MAADNALGRLSDAHPDGWGVAYYIDGAPHVTRSPKSALQDHIFHRLSGVVASETVLAHVRKATRGDLHVLNCHPFQYGRWTFAHNGDIRTYGERRDPLLREVAPRFRRFVLGDTDSEVLFFLFLTRLSRLGPLASRYSIEEVTEALRETLSVVRSLCDDASDPEGRALLTLLVTDGTTMAGVQGGKELFYSTYKTRCADRGNCPHLAPECEAPTRSGFVNHLVFSSEKIAGENVWVEMREGEMVGVDWRMRLSHASVAGRTLPVVR